ncbi:hypothetical protein J6590_055475 [Homalodisca vitripennis]|nr:hypothetical protein J6590_055475 [Homalodisca vitripennis]
MCIDTAYRLLEQEQSVAVEEEAEEPIVKGEQRLAVDKGEGPNLANGRRIAAVAHFIVTLLDADSPVALIPGLDFCSETVGRVRPSPAHSLATPSGVQCAGVECQLITYCTNDNTISANSGVPFLNTEKPVFSTNSIVSVPVIFLTRRQRTKPNFQPPRNYFMPDKDDVRDCPTCVPNGDQQRRGTPHDSHCSSCVHHGLSH